MRLSRAALSAALAAVACMCLVPSALAGRVTSADLQRDLDALVAADGGPPGAIVTLHRGSHIRTLTAGVADVATGRAPEATDHMRIASVTKAYSGAVALRLVANGALELDDTIGELLPSPPPAWSAVTLRQLLNHTSGLPEFTESDGAREHLERDAQAFVSPATIIGWVEADPLNFTPGSAYRYSNTDNIVVGLIAERVTGRPYGELLREIVFEPLGLTRTSFPSDLPLPEPFLHGYAVEPGSPPVDVTTLLSPSFAWASGAIVSTPTELGSFIRGYLGARLFPASLQHQQLRFFEGGESSPPGPGENSAGLAVFRYRTKCGTVYGHTGNLPGYVQFAAATRDGRRAVTTSLNIAAPTGDLLARLREMQETAVCLLLRSKK